MTAQDAHDRTTKPVVIRPAGTMLLVRDGARGIEVLTLKRSLKMRFLPGHIAFPGGSLDEGDWQFAGASNGFAVTAQEHHDDNAYAFAALRECAEEVGFACALCKSGETLDERRLTPFDQQRFLKLELRYEDWLHEQGLKVDLSRLRFVGRWVTPPAMPARFDTRFFLYRMNKPGLTPSVNLEENDWAQWVEARSVVSQIGEGKLAAVPPTIAMLEGLGRYPKVDACFADLKVPGPPAL